MASQKASKPLALDSMQAHFPGLAGVCDSKDVDVVACPSKWALCHGCSEAFKTGKSCAMKHEHSLHPLSHVNTRIAP